MMMLPKSLVDLLKEGDLPFVDFMNLALYSPEYGYYQSDLLKIGPQGDFITAPELTPLFGKALASQCEQVFKTLDQPVILEFGAGTGKLALDILKALEALDALPTAYYILELSQNLRKRQQKNLQTQLPHLMDRIQWLDKWPEHPLKGVFIANEVLDAMPVHRFLQKETGLFESFVHLDANETCGEIFLPCTNPRLENYLKKALPASLAPYLSEANLFIEGWIKACADSLQQGLILLIDYGFPRHEFYHPDRNQGTLLCHYQHKVHSNPFIQVGLQDITAHVDFTEVAECAQKAGLDVAGFSNQASFLINNGLLDLLADMTDERERIKNTQAVKQLIEPQEMGELFKVIALTKGDYFDLNGFQYFDKRCNL